VLGVWHTRERGEVYKKCMLLDDPKKRDNLKTLEQDRESDIKMGLKKLLVCDGVDWVYLIGLGVSVWTGCM
jgi:hypothetical protein